MLECRMQTWHVPRGRMEWGSSIETDTSSMASSKPEMTAATGMVPAWQVLYSVKGRKDNQIIKNLDVCPANIQQVRQELLRF